MKYFITFTEAREQVDRKYQEMGYDRAYKLIEFFTKAEIITFADRTKLSSYLNFIFQDDKQRKRMKRMFNKQKRKKK